MLRELNRTLELLSPPMDSQIVIEETSFSLSQSDITLDAVLQAIESLCRSMTPPVTTIANSI